MSKREPDHGSHAGNEGDALKHPVLAGVATHLVKPGKVFVYAESHAGRPEYVLPMANGKWKAGIGELSKAIEKANGQYIASGDEQARILLAATQAFVQAVKFGGGTWPAIPKGFYLGSTAIVKAVIQQAGVGFVFKLYDTDPNVCNALNYCHLRQVAECKDGYDELLKLQEADLVLVDPSLIREGDIDRILLALEHLVSKGIPFICWTPRLGNDAGQPAAIYAEFLADAQKRLGGFGISPLLVRWSKWRARTCGCCLHVWPGHVQAVARQIVDEIRKAMGWDEA
jgi:23S rRNA A2030 N6-methylase RlmJ